MPNTEPTDVAADTGEEVPTITVSLRIWNRYPDIDLTEITEEVGVVIEAPPANGSEGEMDDWAYDELHPFTGTGREEGDSFYSVHITASSDPALVGRTFDFGY